MTVARHRPERLVQPAAAAARRRMTALVVLVATVAAGGLAMTTGAAAGPSAEVEADQAAAVAGEAVEVVLGPGETAWHALEPYRPEGVDHAAFVHEVLAANDVDARTLRAGEVLIVPDDAGR